ncbi:hypothetical protein JCM21900_005004 [Sporobolomyces salmonicolor]
MASNTTAASSSQRSTASRTRSGGSVPTSHLESTITRLLVCTKSLLEGLAKWSRGEASEEEISAIYVKLGNDFNVACAVFARENISMNELLSVPSDLRVCLETCLSDSPSQATLERHLPQVRQIIIGLLHGLREKQRLYRDGVATRRARDANAQANGHAANVTMQQQMGPPLTPNSAGRSRDELRRFVTQAQQVSVTAPAVAPPSEGGVRHRYSGDRRTASEEAGAPAGPRPSSTFSARQSVTSRSGSLRDSSRSSRATLESLDGGFSSSSSATAMSAAPGLPPLSTLPPLPRTGSDASLASTSGSIRLTSERDRIPRAHSPPPPPRERDDPVPVPRTPTLEQFQSLPAAVPSYSVRPPSIAEPDSNIHQVAQAASLEALKASDNLSRRASKRYSAYAIQKMTSPAGGGGEGSTASPGRGAPGRSRTSDMGRTGPGSSAGRDFAGPGEGPRRSKSDHRPHRTNGGAPHPPLPAIPRSFSSQQDLNLRAVPTSPILEEEDGVQGVPSISPALSAASGAPPSFPPPPLPSTNLPRSTSSTSIHPQSSESRSAIYAPSTALPPLPPDTASQPSTRPPTPASYPFSIFLQIGREVKKAPLAEPPTIPSLRQLFVERFQYNPGIGGWPAIYTRDHEAGVHYELEEMSEVGPGSVLSLNIDTVEQVKQHIDQGLSTLAQDIKELRSTVTAMRRLSVSANAAALLSPESTSAMSPAMRPSPSERQFQDTAQRMLRMRRAVSGTGAPVPESAMVDEREEKKDAPKEDAEEKAEPKEGAAARTSLVGSADSASPAAATGPIVDSLKSQHAEVQNLRREIGILRQVYVDFTSQTKEMFASLRVQNSHVHHLASTKLSTDRAFVEAGTAKLDQDSTDLVVKVDELQDTIEQLRADTVRGVKPRPQQLSETASTLRKAIETRQQLVEWLKEVKPSWSQKWSEELSKILGEQKAVETQETLLTELSEDLDDVAKVFRNIQAVAKQLKPSSFASSSSAGPGLRAVHDLGGAENAQEGLSTILLEVKALQPDPNRRLEAIARAEKQRELELASRTDEFAEELGEFVGMGKLKKSGGIEETERLRQKRSEMTLKAMFNGNA